MGLSAEPCSHLQLSLLGAGVEFKVLNTDGCDDMSLPPRVTGAMREDDLVVTLARPQHVQILRREMGAGLHLGTGTQPSSEPCSPKQGTQGQQGSSKRVPIWGNPYSCPRPRTPQLGSIQGLPGL